jgi:hypothetical protein
MSRRINSKPNKYQELVKKAQEINSFELEKANDTLTFLGRVINLEEEFLSEYNSLRHGEQNSINNLIGSLYRNITQRMKYHDLRNIREILEETDD